MNEIFIHQSTYAKNIMKRIYMNKTHSFVRSLDINKDTCLPHENDEKLVGDDTTYLSELGHRCTLLIILDQMHF